MRYKNLEFKGIEQLINPKNERAVKLAWLNSLGHQIKKEALPDFDVVRNELEVLFRSVFSVKR